MSVDDAVRFVPAFSEGDLVQLKHEGGEVGTVRSVVVRLLVEYEVEWAPGRVESYNRSALEAAT